MATTLEGWYIDPFDDAQLRYRDAAVWTEHIAPLGTHTVRQSTFSQNAGLEPTSEPAQSVAPSTLTADSIPQSGQRPRRPIGKIVESVADAFPGFAWFLMIPMIILFGVLLAAPMVLLFGPIMVLFDAAHRVVGVLLTAWGFIGSVILSMLMGKGWRFWRAF